jgi:hypothetical protein
MKRFIQLTVTAGALLLPSLLVGQDVTTTTSATTSATENTATNSTTTSSAAQPASRDLTAWAVVRAEDNLFKNGDFSEGKTGWKTHSKIVEIDGGKKALEIDLEDKTADIPSTVIRPKSQTKIITVSFKAKATEDGINGTPTTASVEARIFNRKENVYFYYKLPVKKSAGWESYNMKYEVSLFCNDLVCEFLPKGNKGKLYLTDFQAVEIKQR